MSIALQSIDSFESLDKPASIAELHAAQEHAETYGEWLELSEYLDQAHGLEDWKSIDENPVYDSAKLRNALFQLRKARIANNIPELVYLVRTTFSRNIANMGDPRLYTPIQGGTKRLIEEYISECEKALRRLSEVPLDDAPEVLSTLVQTRKAFGRTALVLSGGSTLGFLHAGVLRELADNNLLPRIISGSSAGAIFASIISIHREEEFDKLWEMLEVPMNIFERVGEEEPLFTHIERFLKGGTWIDSIYLKEMLQGLIGDITFQEAYNRTGRILNVTVSVAGSHDMPRLLNYLTAPNVLIWSAVVCSCSVPLVFAADSIIAKDPKTKELYSWTKASFIDGSVDNDMPLGRLAEMFNVNHFVACQVNPHIAPILAQTREIDRRSKSEFDGRVSSGLALALSYTKSLLFNETEHTLTMLKEAGIMRSVASTVLNVMDQEYCGDITIVPPIRWSDVGVLFKNPTTEQVKDLCQRGRKATWPQLSIIRNHCSIELELGKVIVALRSRLIGVDLSPEGRQFDQVADRKSRSAVTLPRVKSFGNAHGSAYGPSSAGRSNVRRTSVDSLFLDTPSPYRRPLHRPQSVSHPVSPKTQIPPLMLNNPQTMQATFYTTSSVSSPDSADAGAVNGMSASIAAAGMNGASSNGIAQSSTNLNGAAAKTSNGPIGSKHTGGNKSNEANGSRQLNGGGQYGGQYGGHAKLGSKLSRSKSNGASGKLTLKKTRTS